MDISDIIAIVAIALPLIVTLYSTVMNNSRTKKQATLDAYNALQEQALDKLNHATKGDYQRIAVNCRLTKEPDESGKTGKEQYDEVRTLIARCEHFAVGVHSGIYDLDLVAELSGVYLYYLYEKLSPVIEAARSTPNGAESYKRFEWLKDEIAKRTKK